MNICGNCDFPMQNHTEQYADENYISYVLPDFSICTRFEDNGYTLKDDAEVEDYDFYHPLLEVSDVKCFEESITREDEWDSTYANRDNYQRMTRDSINSGNKFKRHIYGNFSYRDVEPERCTHAIAWKHRANYGNVTRTGTYATPHLPQSYFNKRGRKVTFTENPTFIANEALDFNDVRLTALEFHELQAFAASVLIDYGITEAFQNKVFNAYSGYSGNFIGSVRLDKDSVTCTKCKATLSIPDTDDRDIMESFTHSVIRHGNNHSTMLAKRSDFTYIHADTCNATHSWGAPCNNAHEPKRVPTKVEALLSLNWAQDFLIQHRKFCTSNACRCTHYYHLLNEVNYGKAA